MKKFLAQKFETLYYFYSYIGYKMFLLLLFNFLSVVMDGFGLTMFIPLLQIADGTTNVEGANADLVRYTSVLFDFLGFPLNVVSMLTLIILLFGLKALFIYSTMSYQVVVLNDFIKKIRIENSVGLGKLEYREFVSTDIGRLQNTLTGEANNVVEACRSYLETIKNGMIVFVYLSFAFLMDWKFSLLVVFGGLLTNFIYNFFYKRTKSLSRDATKLNHEYSSLVIQSINNFKYLKATERNQLFNSRLKTVLEKLITNNNYSGKLGAATSSIREPIMILIICSVIAVQLLIFKTSLSSVLIILVLFYRAMAYIMSVQGTWNQYLTKIGAMENMRSYAKYLSIHKEVNIGQTNIEQIRSIRLQSVSLHFGDVQVLNNINLSLNSHKSYAFVGETGSGKSTLVNVIVGLLKADEGRVIVNDKDSQEINLSNYRSKIGYVSQDPVIFNGDIFDNVTFWAERTPDNLERFWEILKMSSAFDFVYNLPKKENELLGNNGLNLSGGQKQRISIARELYRDVDVLILDEATSALDSHTENEIKESLDRLSGQLMIISIAHRLSTIKDADEIFLLNKGSIEASGGFKDLILKSSYFKKMAELQGLA